MKEVLFRGKRKDNNEWVYGWYAPLVCNDKTVTPSIKDSNGSDWKVEPETVGQYSGLVDNDGKMIFEGDIVKEWSSSWKSPLKTEVSIYEVVCEYLGSLHLIRKTRWGEASTLLYRKSTVEVIGNIHDNPNLLDEVKE